MIVSYETNVKELFHLKRSAGFDLDSFLPYRLSVTTNRVSRAVATLLKRGLVERAAHETDQRLIQLTLSKAGRKIYEAIIPRARAIEAEVTKGLSKADVTALHRILDQVGARLDEMEAG